MIPGVIYGDQLRNPLFRMLKLEVSGELASRPVGRLSLLEPSGRDNYLHYHQDGRSTKPVFNVWLARFRSCNTNRDYSPVTKIWEGAQDMESKSRGF